MSIHLMLDRPHRRVRHDAGRTAIIGFLHVYNAVGTDFLMNNAVLSYTAVEKRVNARYVWNGAGTPVLIN